MPQTKLNFKDMKSFNKGLALVAMALACSTMAGSCSKEYDDSRLWSVINSHEDRLKGLEQLCSRINSDIVSISRIVDVLSSGDMVTSVVPVMDGGAVVGHTIFFMKNTPVTILNGKDGMDGKDGQDGKDGKDGTDGKDGKDGADGSDGHDGLDGKDGMDGRDGLNGKDGADGVDGADGKDGRTPVIGVAMDADGVWYWTLDGDWLRDSSENRIAASGKDGRDGADGADGVTPQLKIEEGWWFVSYDGGSEWTRLGKASQEQTDSTEGLVSGITDGDEAVTIILASGQRIEIPKYRRPEPVSIIVSDHQAALAAGEETTITFSITGDSEGVTVKALTQGGWRAKVEMSSSSTGAIRITAPSPFQDEEILLLAITPDGMTAIASIEFTERHEDRPREDILISPDGKSLRIMLQDTSFTMVHLDPGSFTMGDGTQIDNLGTGYGCMNPRHKVTLTKGFWATPKALDWGILSRFPSLDKELVERAGESYAKDTRNFIAISNVEKVLKAIGADCGLEFRLLTEAEAEYAFLEGSCSGGTQVQDWMSYSAGWFSWGFDISKDATDPLGPPSSTPMEWPATATSKTLAENGHTDWYKVRKGSGAPRNRYTTRRYPIIIALSDANHL